MALGSTQPQSWVQTTRARARVRGCGSFVCGQARDPRYMPQKSHESRHIKGMLAILWTIKLALVIKTSSSLALGSCRLPELQCEQPLEVDKSTSMSQSSLDPPWQEWVPRSFPGGKGGRCLGPTSFSLSCAYFLKILVVSTSRTPRRSNMRRLRLELGFCPPKKKKQIEVVTDNILLHRRMITYSIQILMSCNTLIPFQKASFERW
jgi:hypothetical protein